MEGPAAFWVRGPFGSGGPGLGCGGGVWGVARGRKKEIFFRVGREKSGGRGRGARREGICGVMGVSRGRGGRVLRIKDTVTHPKNTILKEYGKFYMIVR